MMRTALSAALATILLATAASAQTDATPVVPAEEAIANVDLAPLDPAPLDAADVAGVLGESPFCTFRYTSSGGPVLVVGLKDGAPVEAYLKVNGKLVRLGADDGSSAPAASGGFTVAAGPMSATIEPLQGLATAELEEATMIFAIGDALRAGYGGFFACVP